MKQEHVVPNPDGGWSVKTNNASKATINTKTKAEAEKIATEISKNQKAELIVHNKNGQISKKSSFGNDPYPPKG